MARIVRYLLLGIAATAFLAPTAILVTFATSRDAVGQESESEESPDEKAPAAKDKDFEEALIGKDEVKDPPQEILERTISQMRKTQESIEGEKADKDAIDLQQRTVEDDIEKLIALLKKQQQRQKKNQKKNKKNQKKQGQKKDGKQGKKKQGKQKQGKQKSDKNQKGDPQQRLDREKREAEAAARRARLVKDIWGHLPAAVRRQLLNISSEQYLPKYRLEIERYYEDLAERNRRRSN